MRRLSIFFTFCLFQLAIKAQEIKEYRIQPGQTISEVLQQSDIFKYPKFQFGSVVFKDGTTTNSLINYNYLTGDLQFINGQGDTLSVTTNNPIKLIKINNDTFYLDKVFLASISSTKDLKLCQREYIKYNDSRNAGAYDQPISSAAAVTYSSINGSTRNLQLVVRELTILEKVNEFYIGDKFNHFTKLSNKSLFKMFGKKEKEVEDYLNQNKINYKKKEDVLQLFSFLQTL